MAKKCPMNPTPLEYSWWSTHRTTRIVVGSALYISLVIVIGVIIVCLAPGAPKPPICKPMLHPTVRYSDVESSHPRSTAIGDFNNDSHIDLVVANSGLDNVDVFLGYGDCTFATQISYSTGAGSAPRMVTIGDFTSDSRLDIVIANFGTNNIRILFGNVDGNFRNQTHIDTTPSHPLYLAVGDFNRDRHLDIVFVGYGTDIVGIVLGFGNGTFQTPKTFCTRYDSLPYSLAVGDFNNDKTLDIAVANSVTDNLGILLGYGDGTFADQVTYTTGLMSHPYSVAVSDLNNDNYLDIVMANSNADSFGILFGGKNGIFSSLIFHSTGAKSNPIYVSIGDLNKDTKPDIVLVNDGTDAIAVLFGNGNGTFANEVTYGTGFRSSPSSIAIADFNHDNQSDIAVVNQQSNNVKIFEGYINETFASQITYPTDSINDPSGLFVTSDGSGSFPLWIVHSDFNNDSVLDIAVADSGINSIGILLGCGNGTFLPQVTYSTGDNSQPSALALGDFNGDGQIDIAVANSGTNNIGVFLGYRNGTFSSQITSWTGDYSKPTSVAVGDLNNDGILDIVTTTYSTISITILFGCGNGSFSIQKIYRTDDSYIPEMVVLGDLNNDGLLDIVVANNGANNIVVFLAHGDAEFSPKQIYSTGNDSLSCAISLGDINNDNQLDIVVANFGTNTIGVFLGCGNGTFSPQISYSMGGNSALLSISLGDTNNDGALDMVVASFYGVNVGVLLGYGNGTFSSPVIYFAGDEPFPVFVDTGDFNNDGRLDIAVAINGTSNEISIMLGNGNGSFDSPMDFSTGNPSGSDFITVGDFNNDGQLDIAVANYNAGNVAVLLANGNGTFSPGITSSTGSGSTPTSIVTADFNKDNRLDIAVANTGTNNVAILLGHANGTFSLQTTLSTGPRSEPISIVVGDFNNDDRLDIGVINYRFDNVSIFLAYGNDSFSPQITSSCGFGSGTYWMATGDFNNDSRLDITVANQNAGNIGILLGLGNGKFESPMTYSTGNGSMPDSVVVGDFNNDGQLDIAASDFEANNLFIFLGYENGVVALVSIYPLVNYSDPIEIIVGDFNNDGQLDIAVVNCGNYNPFDTSAGDYFVNNVAILFGQGDGNFGNGRIYSVSEDCCLASIATGDFNWDGQLDIVVVNYRSSAIFVLFGQGNGTFPCIDCAESSPNSVAIGDLNNDNYLDIVVANGGTDNIGILLGNGNGDFQKAETYSTGDNSYPALVALGDFDGNSRLDIAVANLETRNVGFFLGYDNGEFSSQSICSTDENFPPSSLAVDDFNNDNHLDVTVALSGTKNMAICFGDGDGNFSLQMVYLAGENYGRSTIAVADFNHDGRIDIAVAYSDDSAIYILLGYGDGRFSLPRTFPTVVYSIPSALAVGDFNNDKNLDIVVLDEQPNEASFIILLGNGNGSFTGLAGYLIEVESRPVAVTVGHFNDDDRLDIGIADNGTEHLRVFLGHGDGAFSNQTTYSTGNGSYPVSIAIGDLNADNQIDVVVANRGTSTVGIFLALRNTNFAERTTLSTGSAASSQTIALGDFTNDGQIDIVIGNDGTHDIEMLISEGNGSFRKQTAYSADSSFYPECIIANDFNNDSRLDIAFVNAATGTVDLIFGNGNGTFGNYTTYSTGIFSNPQSTAIGDFNGDNKKDIAFIAIGDFNSDNQEDIVFVDSDSSSVGLLLKIDIGALDKMRTFSTGSGSNPLGLAIGDFDSDGRSDVAVASDGNGNMVFFFGFENGTFSSRKIVSIVVNTNLIYTDVGDLNNDTYLDVIIMNDYPPVEIFVLLGNGDGTFEIEITGISEPVDGFVTGDFNSDDRLDIVLYRSDYNIIEVLLGHGDGTFENPPIYSTDDTNYPNFIGVGDFDNDKRLDMAVSNGNGENVGIFLGLGDGKFSPPNIFFTGAGTCPALIAVGDFDSDNQLDIVVVDPCIRNIGVLFGYGNGAFSAPTKNTWHDDRLLTTIDVADFNNDGRLDIAILQYYTGHLNIFLGHVNGTFFTQITYTTGDASGPISCAAADLDNDGRLDIVVSNMLKENIGVFLGYASENFVSVTAYTIEGSSQPVSVAVGDFNSDTHLDVVVADQATNGIVLLHGSGYGTFSNPYDYSTGDGSQPSWVAVDDFNQDQQLDVAVVNSGTNNIAILLGNRNGEFSSLTTYSTGHSSSPVSLAVGHFDNDTHLDIAVANFGSGNVYLFLGYGNGSFARPSFFSSTFGSHPSAVAFGDVNGDNRGDVVICDNGFSTVEVVSMTCSLQQ